MPQQLYLFLWSLGVLKLASVDPKTFGIEPCSVSQKLFSLRCGNLLELSQDSRAKPPMAAYCTVLLAGPIPPKG